MGWRKNEGRKEERVDLLFHLFNAPEYLLLTFTYHLNYSPAAPAAPAPLATLALTRAPGTKEEKIPQKERLHLADHVGMAICNVTTLTMKHF
jgi:hypothetical protein